MEHISKALDSLQATKALKSISKTTAKTIPKKWVPSSGLIAQCQEQLSEIGYASDPYCQTCRGLGLLHPLLDSGRPDYSSTIPCPAKGCIKDSRAVYKQGEASLKEKGISSKSQSFENFDSVLGVKETYQAFKDLATGEANYQMLLCYGGTGNGKTHLCNALTTELNKREIDARLYAVADMVGRLKESISEHTTESVIKQLTTIPALILDDFKVEFNSPWEMGKIEDIIDARYREALITVLTTNRALEELPERLISRFYDPLLGRVVLNSGADYRRRRRKG